eukprot:13803109-Alexandrium_andersonii.AAC.1
MIETSPSSDGRVPLVPASWAGGGEPAAEAEGKDEIPAAQPSPSLEQPEIKVPDKEGEAASALGRASTAPGTAASHASTLTGTSTPVGMEDFDSLDPNMLDQHLKMDNAAETEDFLSDLIENSKIPTSTSEQEPQDSPPVGSKEQKFKQA